MTGRSAPPASADPGLLDRAWRADPDLFDPAYPETMADTGIQTALPRPEPPPPAPEWLIDLLHNLAEFFRWSAPALRWLLALLAALALLLILRRLAPVFAAWIARRRAPPDEAPGEEAGAAEARAAQARLADADALAGEGRFAEAVHVLLHRSIDDIAGRRPGLVRPAVTARGLAASADLPGAVRAAFAAIARVVELSLFGGGAVDAAAWDKCRVAYADLTIAKNWVDA